MDIKNFIENFADLFEETDNSVFTPETKFRDIDEWSSLLALSVMAMVDEEYEVQLKADDMRGVTTVQGLFDVVQSKKQK